MMCLVCNIWGGLSGQPCHILVVKIPILGLSGYGKHGLSLRSQSCILMKSPVWPNLFVWIAQYFDSKMRAGQSGHTTSIFAKKKLAQNGDVRTGTRDSWVIFERHSEQIRVRYRKYPPFYLSCHHYMILYDGFQANKNSGGWFIHLQQTFHVELYLDHVNHVLFGNPNQLTAAGIHHCFSDFNQLTMFFAHRMV